MSHSRALAPFACLLVACGGSFSAASGGTSDGGDASSSEDGSSSGGGDAAADSSSGGGGDGAASETGAPDAPAVGDATSLEGSTGEAGVCADISGGYGQITATGLGCGNLNTLASECILLAQEICAFQLVSGATALPPAVNGLVMLQSDGSFSGADLQLGTTQRMGCLGQWAPGTQTLTIQCGGKGTSQSCGVSMVRKGSTCP